MIYLKLFMQINLLLFLSFTLSIIPWIPSLLVEKIVNIMMIILIVISVFLVYKTIRISYDKQKKKALWKTILYTVGLLIYIALFIILMIGVAYSKGVYVKEYMFDKKIFYVYQNSELSYEVSVKESILPIRSVPIASFQYTPIVLKTKGKYLYATGEQIDKKIYDLEKNNPINDTNNTKEQND